MLKKFEILDKTYELDDNYTPLNDDNNFCNADKIPFLPQYVRTVTMCLHISESCNLNCKYCFKKIGGELSLDDIKRFIDCVTHIYPNADRYIIDMSGAGEPLLHKDLAMQIAKYCKALSDKYLREFLPTFVTNGVLLTPETVGELQAAGILFGVSLDGTKENHDKNRVFHNGKGSYDTVVNNIRKIEHNDYVGLAMTYSDGNLLESFLSMSELLPTVSMKPVRFTDGQFDAKAVCDGYDKLIRFLLSKTLSGDKKYIYAVVNGDDYFGKFLKRVLLGQKVYGRCDAGIARFSLAGDKNIYFCPAAVGIEGGAVGDLEYGIRRRKIQEMWDRQKNGKCNGCFARDVCGGECKIVSYNRYGTFNGVDPVMCQIKRHLFLLAKYFADSVKQADLQKYNWLLDTVNKIEGYYSRDQKLINAAKYYSGKYTYSQLKEIKDNEPEKFDTLYKDAH
ncbi:MAG: radical SAM protein [Clostridiales bacterium]|nr:radical SAM protein [Clostridiales bacterium]